jgi:uncharacterized oxidoreductase
MDILNSTVLITGGATGIGFALAKALLANGNTVIICARSANNLTTAEQTAPGIKTYRCDISSPEQTQNMLAAIKHDGYNINVLVNNAGVISPLDLLQDHETAAQNMAQEMAINALAPISLVHQLLPDLLQQKNAAIINIGSPAGIIAIAQTPGYSISKSALHAYTQVLRYHLKDSSVKVMEIFPPSVATKMSEMNGRPDMACDIFAQKLLRAIAKGKPEVWIGEANIVRVMVKLPGYFAFNLINKMVPLIKRQR